MKSITIILINKNYKVNIINKDINAQSKSDGIYMI